MLQGNSEATELWSGELVTKGIALVQKVAARFARRLPPNVDISDLIGAGNEGMLQAISSYDPARSARFESYAESRVRGAILDELRAADSLTRHGRRKWTNVSEAIQRLESRSGSTPSALAVATELGMTLDAYHTMSSELARGVALSWLSDPHAGAATSDDDPLAACSDAQLRDRLAELVRELPERTQRVLALYYQHDSTQAEIGILLGITESRVCQLRALAIQHLRAEMEAFIDDLPEG